MDAMNSWNRWWERARLTPATRDARARYAEAEADVRAVLVRLGRAADPRERARLLRQMSFRLDREAEVVTAGWGGQRDQDGMTAAESIRWQARLCEVLADIELTAGLRGGIGRHHADRLDDDPSVWRLLDLMAASSLTDRAMLMADLADEITGIVGHTAADVVRHIPYPSRDAWVPRS
jgi:hypothetical protein